MDTISQSLIYLPEQMRSREAWAMLYAIGMQESRFQHRRQIRGPARGWWQFERIGLQEVVTGRMTREHFAGVCRALNYPLEIDFLFEAIAHNDTLACCAARLLLWPDPAALPGQEDTDASWQYYLRRWRPGKPHAATWPEFWREAWEVVP